MDNIVKLNILKAVIITCFFFFLINEIGFTTLIVTTMTPALTIAQFFFSTLELAKISE